MDASFSKRSISCETKVSEVLRGAATEDAQSGRRDAVTARIYSSWNYGATNVART
jgi:hypothetical protein